MNVGKELSKYWIPVEERMPDPYESVLIQQKNTQVRIAHWDASEECWILDNDYRLSAPNVFEWMPLPELSDHHIKTREGESE